MLPRVLVNYEVVYYVRNKLIVGIPTSFNCNKLLGCSGFKLKKKTLQNFSGTETNGRMYTKIWGKFEKLPFHVRRSPESNLGLEERYRALVSFGWCWTEPTCYGSHYLAYCSSLGSYTIM
jgi:hypothetical protein